MTYWAKEDERYEEHILKCYSIWQRYFKINSLYLADTCKKMDIKYEDFRQKSLISVLFHDVGKLTAIFQDNMELIRNGKKPNYQKNFRHEIYSAILLLVAYIQRKKADKDEPIPYEVLAVLGHHKPLDKQWHSFLREINRDKWPEFNKEMVDFALFSVKDILKRENINFAVDQELYAYNWQKNFFRALGSIFSTVNLYKLKINYSKERQIYSLLKGILSYCDWLASSDNYKDIHYTVPQNITQLQDQIKQKLAKENKIFEMRPFHKKCMLCKEDALVIAPTGSGKTEGALYWALNKGESRISFFMPTMVTSNSLFERISHNYIQYQACGITHSGAQTYFALQDSAEEYDDKEIRFKLLHLKAFIPPMMISTVDQMLSAGFNSGLWNFKEISLIGCAVIFDEIHAYDTYTLALITETIKKIKLLDGRVMLMSATMPKMLREHFFSLLPELQLISADERMNIARNEWRYLDESLTDIRGLVEQYLQEGKRVAIVVNDIETAKEEYKYWDYKGYNTLCYHSEFIMKDRLEKEEQLTDKEKNKSIQLVIATQAMEVSLDVSFDFMFSECAPMESLIQRVGRCNRYNENLDSIFYIYNYSDISYSKVYKESQKILENTRKLLLSNQGRLSEKDIAQLLDEIYAGYEIYDDNYKKGESIYQRIAEDEFIFDITLNEEKTRDFKYVKISVIPVQYYDEVKELFLNKKYASIPLYEVPIGIGKFIKLQKANRYVKNDFNLPIYEVQYNSEYGIDMEKVNDTFDIC